MDGEMVKEFRQSLTEIKSGIEETKRTSKEANESAGAVKAALTKVEQDLTAEREEREKMEREFDKLRKQWLQRGSIGGHGVRMPGRITDGAARELAAVFILHCLRSGYEEAVSRHNLDAVLRTTREILGVEAKTALTTSDIPLPTSFTGELRELIAEFGVARRNLMPYPITMGTVRPPRMGTRPAFGSIAMSAPIGEKSPTITFASLESHKLGGLVRLPREIDEQSIVPMGQFLARYGAVEFARAEDLWAFLADGTATYESVSGICPVVEGLGKIVTLGATKTAPSDATLADFRAMRRKVSTAALGRAKYYLNLTWETRLRSFNTEAEPNVFVWNGPGGRVTLDGFPIEWTEILTPYDTAAAVSSYLSVFGDLSFWLFGEHGSPRVDTSEHVFFANDQLATRFLEEIDFDYLATDAAATLKTAAA